MHTAFFDILSVTNTGNPFIDFLTGAGAIGILAYVVIAFQQGWFVTGSQLKKVEAERDRAMELVFEMAKVSAKSLDIAEKKVHS